MPLTEPPVEKPPVEKTEWEGGEVSYFHTSEEGEWIEVQDSNLIISLDEAV